MGLATDHQWTGSLEPDGAAVDGIDFWYYMLNNTALPRTELPHYADQYGYVSIQVGDYKYTRADTPAEFYTPPGNMRRGQSSAYQCTATDFIVDTGGYVPSLSPSSISTIPTPYPSSSSGDSSGSGSDHSGDGVDSGHQKGIASTELNSSNNRYLIVAILLGTLVGLLAVASMYRIYKNRVSEAEGDYDGLPLSSPSTHALVNGEGGGGEEAGQGAEDRGASSNSTVHNQIHSFSITGDDDDDDGDDEQEEGGYDFVAQV